MCLRYHRQMRDLFVMSKPRPRIFLTLIRMNFKRAGIILSVDNDFSLVYFGLGRPNRQIIENKD